MEAKSQQEELYNKFAQEWSEVKRLAKAIEAKIGCPVEVRQTKGLRWGFYAPKNFAFARKRQEAKRLRISTKEEWAISAGLSGYCVAPKGWWGQPAAWVEIIQSNAESLEEIAGLLARVCKARHC